MKIQSLEYRLDQLENMLLMAGSGGEIRHIEIMLELLERRVDKLSQL